MGDSNRDLLEEGASSLSPGSGGNVVTDLERTIRAIYVLKEGHKERIHVKIAC